jgi:hypothetical protein
LPTARTNPLPSSEPLARSELTHPPIPLAQAAAPTSPPSPTESPSSLAQANSPSPTPTTTPEPKPASEQASSAVPVPAPAPAPRRERPPSTGNDWRTQLDFLAQLFQFGKRTPAPIEDRRPLATPPANRPPSAQQPQPPRQNLAPANPNVIATPSPPLIISLEDTNGQVSRPSTLSPQLPPPQSAAEIIPRSSPTIRDDAKPSRPEESRAAAPPSWSPAPRAFSPPQATPVAPAEYAPSYRGSEYAVQARRMLAQSVPRIAIQAQSEIANVLRAAANANDPRQERVVVDAAQAVLVREDASGPSQVVDPMEAKRLYGQALHAYWTRRNAAEAFDLQLRAFGADPRDPEIAGNLAFLYLKLDPAQPELARQLALHAIAVRGTRFRTGRLEDWNTYAIASALTGRDTDARNAMYATVALARNVEWNCKAAQNAIASYGERLREPVEAMLYRIYSQGRAHESPYCAWPPKWAASARSN